MTLEALLAKWKTIQILKGFLDMARKGWGRLQRTGKVLDLSGPGEVKEAFFGEQIYLGDTVRVRGRLSQYCPVYMPVAYSPQAHFGNPTTNSWVADFNPAPTSTFIRAGSGCTLAFLFHESARETARIVSKYHPDRTQVIPFHLADPSVPVLLDSQSERFLEEIVEVKATLVRLDDAVREAIEASDEEVVKLYYHTFFSDTFIPQKGYVLDARSVNGGEVISTSKIAPFETSLATEIQVKTEISAEEIEGIVGGSLKKAFGTGAGPMHYRPAYYTPPGYEIKQIALGPLITHFAPEFGVINSAVVIDTTNPNRDNVHQLLLPHTKRVLEGVREADPGSEFSGLFASDASFLKALEVPRPSG